MLDRLRKRIEFLKAWIAYLNGCLEGQADYDDEDYETADKVYQLEEELNLKTVLVEKWSAKQAEVEKETEEQKRVLLAEGHKMLARLKGLDIRDDPKAIEHRKGILERNLMGSHGERWTDFWLAAQIVRKYSKLAAV